MSTSVDRQSWLSFKGVTVHTVTHAAIPVTEWSVTAGLLQLSHYPTGS